MIRSIKKCLVLIVTVLALIPMVTSAQSEQKPKYAPGKEKHRNKTDEIGQKQGVWKYYNSGGELIHEIEYVNDVRHGMSKRFYPYGKIMEETEYQNGIKEGTYLRYFYSYACNLISIWKISIIKDNLRPNRFKITFPGGLFELNNEKKPGK